MLDLQLAQQAGGVTAYELALVYISRIQKYDISLPGGRPGLQSIIELSPDALSDARKRDRERANGKIRGPLHGIPVLLKDNISTGDRMHTTAGAAALIDLRAGRDAFITAQLRAAGALILGKANLSEFANFVSRSLPNGYSAVGGRVRNPYGSSFDPLGSSSGSAVAVSANLVSVAVGSETAGSIVAPAAANSVVGVYPSRGLVSRRGIIPLADELDTAGPLARTVHDAAALLNVLAAIDPGDRFAAEAHPLRGLDFTKSLDTRALSGKTVGFIPPEDDKSRSMQELVTAYTLKPAWEALAAAGAQVRMLERPAINFEYLPVLKCGIKFGLRKFLEEYGQHAAVHSLEDIVTFNRSKPERYIPYGQELLEEALEENLAETEYRELAANNRRKAANYIHQLKTEAGVDVLISLNNTFSGEYAFAGYPAVCVPAGFTEDGRPFGLTFVGDYLQDEVLLGYAFAFEHAQPLRRPPVLE